MKRIALSLTPIVALALACGGAPGGGKPVQNKESAAAATYQLVDEKKGLENQGQSGSGLSPAQFDGLGNIDENGVSTDNSVTVQGRSGSADINTRSEVRADGVFVTHTVKYNNFSSDGVNFYDGEMTHVSSVSANESGASIVEEVNGSVSISGTYASQLDVNARIAVEVINGAVRITINGSISADGVNFSYDGDVLDLGADGTLDPSETFDPTDPTDPTKLSDCQGNFNGSYTGTESGIANATYSEDILTVNFVSATGLFDLDAEVSVRQDGTFRGTDYGTTIDGILDASDCTLSGTWVNAAGAGTFTLTR